MQVNQTARHLQVSFRVGVYSSFLFGEKVIMKYESSILGFSLVELSVVLIIIGVTLGSGLTLATKKTEADKAYETETKLDNIEEALTLHLGDNLRLPCPADGSLAFSNASFGDEGTPSSTACASSNFNDSGNVYAGIIPTKTLGLPDDQAIDGWGRRFTYVIDYRLANNTTTNGTCSGNSNCFQATTNGSITVNDASGTARTTQAVYVLISHGKNGHGAYLRNGSATRLDNDSTDTDEQQNSMYDQNGVNITPYNDTFVQKTSTTTFDDVVRYKLRWQVVDGTDGVTSASVCSAVKDVVDNPDPASNSTCTGASSITVCEALATKIHQLCFQL